MMGRLHFFLDGKSVVARAPTCQKALHLALLGAGGAARVPRDLTAARHQLPHPRRPHGFQNGRIDAIIAG